MRNAQTLQHKISPTGRRLHLTEYQKDFLATIKSLTDRFGFSPTYEEIAEAYGMSKVSTVAMVRKLVARGYLTQIKGKYRTIRLA